MTKYMIYFNEKVFGWKPAKFDWKRGSKTILKESGKMVTVLGSVTLPEDEGFSMMKSSMTAAHNLNRAGFSIQECAEQMLKVARAFEAINK